VPQPPREHTPAGLHLGKRKNAPKPNRRAACSGNAAAFAVIPAKVGIPLLLTFRRAWR